MIDLSEMKTYTIDELEFALANLENGISEPQERMARIKLPIPKEYGGGWATGKTQEEAVRHLIERISLKQTATDSPTFNECWAKWILIKMGVNSFDSSSVRSSPLSPCTIESYKRIAKDKLLPFFGDIPIQDITPDQIQLFYNSIMHLSKSYGSQCRAILKGIFNRAERMGYIQSNPMRFEYDRPTRQRKKVILQDDDLIEVMQQLEKLDGRDYIYACFLCFTALRRGEILGLRWSDLDFKNGLIYVRNNVVFPDGKNDCVVKEPKDGSSGVVHMQTNLARRIFEYKDEGYLIHGKNKNEPITRSSFTKMWYRINKAIDLKGATSHCFRATYATMMNAHCDHIDVKALQGALRHKTPDLAVKVYTKENTNKTLIAEKEYDKWLHSQLSQASL